MARMTDEQEQERGEVEDALAIIARARTLLRTQIVLRVRQGVDRDGRLGALLQPAIEYLGQVDQALERAQGLLGAQWRAGQRSGWRRVGK